MSKSIRIKTTPGEESKNLNIQINQKFDFIEVLSLKISQEEVYKRYSSDYGVVIGRILINNGLGVPNAKVSIFIPIDDEDKKDSEIFGLYPFEVITDKDVNGYNYSLLSKTGRGKHECYTPVGAFPNKREVQDNPDILDIYKKYYKFTTTTNNSGDYMLFGVPVGAHHVHVEADISDIGMISQRPYDLISKGVDKNKFYSGNKFKNRTDDSNPTQIKSVSPISINVIPFWGDIENGEIGISRVDVDLKTTITPSAIFMGSIFSDSEKNSVNKNCRPREKLGQVNELVSGEGTIHMIRETIDGNIEQYDIEGGQVIDENGTWAYQIPMNLDYKVTSEDGRLIPSKDSSKGIPTRAKVRFKVDMSTTGDEGRLRTRAKYLVPHNPENYEESDYSFDNSTREKNFANLHWNKIYSVKNHITRVQPNKLVKNRNFIGIKDVDEGGVHNPFPFNKLDTKATPLFAVICIILSIVIGIICLINSVIVKIINFIFRIVNMVLKIVCKVTFSIAKLVCELKHVGVNKGDERADCRKNSCMGCSEGKHRDCHCDNILPYVGYIVLTCGENDSKYAPCAKRYGNKINELTYDATVETYYDEEFYEPGDDAACGEKLNTQKVYFRYSDDGECHEPIKILGLVNVKDAGFLDCMLLTIAEALNVFKFDFYNDWVNGTLYSFLLKYTRRKNGNNKFCDNDSSSKNNYILDSCTISSPQDPNPPLGNDNTGRGWGVDSSMATKIEEGYIKKFEDELFYAAYSKNKPYKLFATDIINLGSIFECDWQGIPRLHPFLIGTTYNAPPLVAEYLEGEYGTVYTSGYNSTSCNHRNSALIGHITCTGLQTGARQCNNIDRLSELGMGLDEYRVPENLGATDNMILNNDIENPYIRGAFIYSNIKDELNVDTIPLVYIDGDNDYDYKDMIYNIYRKPKPNTIWQYANSLYFYFGLHEGKTALSKLNSKFFPTCVPEVDNDFFLIANDIIEDDYGPEPTGGIDISVIGGIAPYLFEWVGPTVNGVDYPIINNTEDITNLYTGTYKVKVTDKNGRKAEGVYIVPGPPSISSDIQTTPTSVSGAQDGEINVTISSGTLPYKIELWNNTTNTLLNTFNNIITNSFNIPNLRGGEYRVISSDSGTPTTISNNTTVVTEPTQLNIGVTGQNVTCFGENNGIATVNISGGEPPYTILWDNGSSNERITGLTPGVYSVVVTDSVKSIRNNSYTVSSSNKIKQTTVIKFITCLLTNDTQTTLGTTTKNGSINLNTVGGQPPYTHKLTGGQDDVNITKTGSIVVFDELNYGSNTYDSSYTLTTTDNNGCVAIEEINIHRPSEKLGGTITKTGNTLVATGYNGFTSTYDERTQRYLGFYEYRWQVSVDGGLTWENSSTGDTKYTNTGTWRCIIRDFNTSGTYCEYITDIITM